MDILHALGVAVAMVFIGSKLNRSGGGRLPSQDNYPPPGDETAADVERLILAGRRIDAIKLYREIHNVGLKASKEAVDKLASVSTLGNQGIEAEIWRV